MSYREFVAWIKYRNLRGSLNVGRRVEQSVARSTAFFGNMMARSKTLKAEDFAPYEREPEREGTVDDVFALLSSIATKE